MNTIKEILDEFIRQTSTSNIETKSYPKHYKGLNLKISFGKGNIAKVPWIAFLKDSNTIRSGIYPIILYYKERNELILAYGISSYFKPIKDWNIPYEYITLKEYFRNKEIKEVHYLSSIYNSSYLAIKDNLENLIANLENMLDVYKTLN